MGHFKYLSILFNASTLELFLFSYGRKLHEAHFHCQSQALMNGECRFQGDDLAVKAEGSLARLYNVKMLIALLHTGDPS